MSAFDDFINKLIDLSSGKRMLKIKGVKKTIKGMVKLTTKNYPGSEYIKVIFDDKSFLLIMINDREIYYADSIVKRIPEVTDDMIGEVEFIKYCGKEYKLGNKDDYQYVIQRYVGTNDDIEGEARFSDYFPISGSKEYLSLGWLSETGERADINCRIIGIKDVSILK